MNLIGHKYGRLIVISEAEPSITPGGRKVYYWNCKCDCGNYITASTSSLRQGSTTSCGCYQREQASKATICDLSGKRFGRLTVIERSSRKSGTYWSCVCDCGNKKEVLASHLIKGGIRSCGCLRKEVTGEKKSVHNESKTRLYKIWKNMRERCNNPHNHAYRNYGGRGIKVCDEWNREHGYIAFRDWALQNGYKEELSIDRINVNGMYEPSNCRWVTLREQANNTRCNVLIEYKGETHTLAEWAKILGIKYQTLHRRIRYCGWDVEKAFTDRSNLKFGG